LLSFGGGPFANADRPTSSSDPFQPRYVDRQAGEGKDREAVADNFAIRRHLMSKPPIGTRRSTDPRQAAEAAFKKATTKPVELPPKAPVIPGTREMVSLRIDREVLDFFQEGGPGWQDRINDALRKAAGK
jgi:uncharacterized protein (DUF4415 family)